MNTTFYEYLKYFFFKFRRKFYFTINLSIDIIDIFFLFTFFVVIFSIFYFEPTGIFMGENIVYDPFFLGEKTLLRKTFQIYQTDTVYRGREICNVFNFFEAYIILFFIKIGFPKFHSFIHIFSLCIISVGFIQFVGSNEILKKNKMLIYLFFLNFLLFPSIYFSSILHFRTSKIMSLFLFLWVIAKIFNPKHNFSLKNSKLFIALCVMLCLVDEQGFFLEIFIFSFILIYLFFVKQDNRTFNLLFIFLFALTFRIFYYRFIGPYFHETLTEHKITEIDFASYNAYKEELLLRIFQPDLYIDSFISSINIQKQSLFFDSLILMSIFFSVTFFFLIQKEVALWKSTKWKTFFVSPKKILFILILFFSSNIACGFLHIFFGRLFYPIIYYNVPKFGFIFIFYMIIFYSSLKVSSKNQKNIFYVFILFFLATNIHQDINFYEKEYKLNIDALKKMKEETIIMKECIYSNSPVESFLTKFTLSKDSPTQRTFYNYSYMCNFYRNQLTQK